MLIVTRFRLQHWGVMCSNEVDLGPRPMKMETGRVRSMPPLTELPEDVREVDSAVKSVRAEYRRLLIMAYCYRGGRAEKAERMGLTRKTFNRQLLRAETAVDQLIA